MSEPGLTCADVHLVRRDPAGEERTVLRGVNASFPAGRVALVSGSTGVGKTTLLHVLAGLIRPTAGEVQASEQPVSRWTAAHRDRWRREVGIVFQALYLLPDLGALENVVAPLAPRAWSLGELRAAGLRALEQAGAARLAARSVGSLSGGERQRVCLARALVGRPAFLLADEPTAYQDPEGVARVVACLEEARERNAVVVVASHDPRLSEADLAWDRWLLRDGELGPG